MRYAIINTTTSKIENVVEYDSTPSSPPPGFDENYIAVQNDTVGTNWSYANGEFIAPPAPPNTLPAQALTALSKSDITVIRCYSVGIAVPAANQTYRNALRAIVNGTDTTSTVLPTEPTEPMGI